MIISMKKKYLRVNLKQLYERKVLRMKKVCILSLMSYSDEKLLIQMNNKDLLIYRRVPKLF